MTDARPPHPPISRWRRHVKAGWLIYWLVLTCLLLSPKVPRSPITISQKGLVIHATTFALLAYGCWLTRRTYGLPYTRRWAIRWGIIFAAYAGLTEILQPYAGRHCDFWDFFVDALGAAVVLALLAFTRHPMDRFQIAS